jgi:hypothetical protein
MLTYAGDEHLFMNPLFIDFRLPFLAWVRIEKVITDRLKGEVGDLFIVFFWSGLGL